MNTKVVLTIFAILIVASPLIIQCTPVSACTPFWANKTEVTYDSTNHYTRYVGQLAGATYEIFMPDNWNRQLVIGCKGYTLSTTEMPKIDSLNTHTIGLQFMASTAASRFAYATSTYGQVGFNMKEGMTQTLLLTTYVMCKFRVTGDVFLVGLSMGGQIALMLADKFPHLYAGVLDVCGNKDTTAFYNYWKDLTQLPADPTAIRTYLKGSPASLPVPFANAIPDASLLLMRTSAAQVMTDVEAEFGGTPESKPHAYDGLSPTCHADIPVPVISMVARSDLKVPIQHFNAYYDAVTAEGCLSNYRSYTFMAQHCDSTIINNIPIYFQKLTDWVNGIAVPNATPRPLP